MTDPVTETINTYNKYAQQYFERSHTEDSSSKLYIDILKGYLKHGKILDIGSGTGRDSKLLIENGFDVVGIDLADEMLKIAKREIPSASFLKMDARHLDFPKKFFDGVWALGSLLHIPRENLADVLRQIYSVLKDGGIFVISMKEGQGEEYKINKGDNNLNDAKRFFTYYTESELRGLLELTGFKVLHVENNQTRDNNWMGIFSQKI